VAIRHRQHERRWTLAPPPAHEHLPSACRRKGRRIVHVGTELEQKLHRVGLAGAHGEQEGREAGAFALGQVGAAGHQRADDCGVAVGGPPHQRRLIARALLGVRVGPVLEQRRHRVDLAGARRRHQRRLAVGVGSVRIGARRQEQLDQRRVAGAAGEEQRRDAVAVGCVGVRLRADERRCGVDVVEIRGPVQRRRPVRRRRVHLAAILDQLANRRRVAAANGVDERHAARCAHVMCGAKRQRQRDRHHGKTDGPHGITLPCGGVSELADHAGAVAEPIGVHAHSIQAASGAGSRAVSAPDT
jgi:hypothetical protein